MFSIEDVKKKRVIYERQIEDIIKQFEKELPPEVTIDNIVAIKHVGEKEMKCNIKLVVEDLNK